MKHDLGILDGNGEMIIALTALRKNRSWESFIMEKVIKVCLLSKSIHKGKYLGF